MLNIPHLWIYGLETLTSIDEKNLSLRASFQADGQERRGKKKKRRKKEQ